MIFDKGGDITHLPKLYSHSFTTNEILQSEREVEITLIEPLLIKLGYTSADWVRQLSVRMGRGERNFPDYAFLTDASKHYETASMLIESKYHIKNNREMEEIFKQVWSYGQRLSAIVLVIADKDCIWVYQRQVNNAFDRTKYIRKFWKELENPESFNVIKKRIGKKN